MFIWLNELFINFEREECLMRVVLQRVNDASVSVKGQVIGKINHGIVLLVGFTKGDTSAQIDYLVHKIVNARIFEDSEGKMNLNLKQIHGQILSISQFTLYAETRKGNRPSFTQAQKPEMALINYDEFNKKLREQGVIVETGKFGADMKVRLVNDGPVTIIYEESAVEKK